MLDQDASLGTSHFTETMRYQHALETELSRTVGSMRGIESARVHLAVPKQSVFVRDREQASASVMIRPLRGGSIGEEQVSAIVGLVSSSIPGRVRAVVTAELDFSAVERTEELFEPDPAQLRSEQTETRRDVLADAIGIPGALTNQPPGDGVVDPQAAADEQQPETVPTDASAIRNFELDRSITHLRQSPGSIIRLSAAVIIDDRLVLADDGTVERVPLEPEQLATFEQLAREAIGFDQERGDTVVVSNQSFEPIEEFAAPEPLPIWQQDWVWTMVRQSLVGLAVLLLVMLVVRPAVRRLGVLNRPELAVDTNAQLNSPDTDEAVDGEQTDGSSDKNTKDGDGSLLPDPPVADDQGSTTARGASQAAILLMALGEEEAANVLRHMEPDEVQSLGEAMGAIKGVSQDEIGATLDGFVGEVRGESSLGLDAENVLSNMPDVETGSALDALKWMHPSVVARVLRDEHPQIIATVLCRMSSEQAGDVIGRLPEDIHAD